MKDESRPAILAPSRLALAEQIANAVLYEGYILYPYRPSAVKNQQRWTFGGVYPQAYSLSQQGSDAWTMQTECLIQERETESSIAPVLDVRVRFLHIQERIVGELDRPLSDLPTDAEPAFHRVEALRVGKQTLYTWQEAVEREIRAENLSLSDLLGQPHQRTFAFPSERRLEAVRAPGGQVVGVLARQQQAIEGAIEIAAKAVAPHLFKATVRILNLTPWKADSRQPPTEPSRAEAVMHAFISTHTILSVRESEFISLIDPPAQFGEVAAGCRNLGSYPILVGEEGERDMMLSSPIILYDYPQIAPESAGDLFDGTEIDEILTLRIMALTEEEKQEVREADDRARALLDRTEALPPEMLMKLHGVVRSLRPLNDEEQS